tara:strand:- start:1225 stop:1377 length:153 start_codon:yes stop_codon:yes gene_type:complete
MLIPKSLDDQDNTDEPEQIDNGNNSPDVFSREETLRIIRGLERQFREYQG